MGLRQAWNDRYERWLLDLSRHLASRGIAARVLYDDRPQGDRLVLALPVREGYAELQVHRTRAGAALYLLADGRPALQALVAALLGHHRQVSRLENARRKFLHEIERMAQHLELTLEARVERFPRPALALLRSAVPDARAMAGIRGAFHAGRGEEERLASEGLTGRDARRANRYPLCFAARLCAGGQCRAALFDAARGGFRLNGELAALLSLAGVGLAAPALAQVGVAGEEPGIMQRIGERLEGAGELAVDAADVADAGSSCVDCPSVGGCDLPDCDTCDLPDLGGCDLPLPDCAL